MCIYFSHDGKSKNNKIRLYTHITRFHLIYTHDDYDDINVDLKKKKEEKRTTIFKILNNNNNNKNKIK